MPLISILMPVHNAEAYLTECLESIAAQTFTDFELVAIDDGSADRSAAILDEWAARDSRFRCLRNETNLGIARTRNRLFAECSPSSRFLALMDADDICFPDRLERQRAFLEANPDVGAVGSALEIIDEHSRTIGLRRYPTTPDEIRRRLPGCNVLAQPAMMLRREMIVQVGPYALDCPVCSDYEYWLRALPDFDFANLPDPVLRYRLSGTQCKQKRLKQSLRATLRIQRNYLRKTRSCSLYALVRHLAGYGLLFLPDRVVLALFQRLSFREKKHV